CVSKRLNHWILLLIMKRNALNVVELELSTVKIDAILVTLALRKRDSLIVRFTNKIYPLYVFDSIV
ncbi:MAG TPA: hypothetical protein VFY50_03730, partial [Candidatus Nitrosocosmicus sp.]|nr:hypothetical protein [Candidatus Nitrosocosmicus sp.]